MEEAPCRGPGMKPRDPIKVPPTTTMDKVSIPRGTSYRLLGSDTLKGLNQKPPRWGKMLGFFTIWDAKNYGQDFRKLAWCLLFSVTAHISTTVFTPGPGDTIFVFPKKEGREEEREAEGSC